MPQVTETDVVRVLGPVPAFVLREIVRTGASVTHLRDAATFVANEACRGPRAYAALAPRMRRLVDLVAVVGIATDREHAA